MGLMEDYLEKREEDAAFEKAREILTPPDYPQGASVVLMSVTLFREWVDRTPGVSIVEFGEPTHWCGNVYSPTVTRRD